MRKMFLLTPGDSWLDMFHEQISKARHGDMFITNTEARANELKAIVKDIAPPYRIYIEYVQDIPCKPVPILGQWANMDTGKLIEDWSL